MLTLKGICRGRRRLYGLGKLLLLWGLPHQAASPKDFGKMVFLGVETRSVGVALVADICDSGEGSLRLKASVIVEAGRPPFQFCPSITPTAEEKHGKAWSGQVSSHRTTCCADLAVI
jgi:hypothetical protein